jgi:hypothetical protein
VGIPIPKSVNPAECWDLHPSVVCGKCPETLPVFALKCEQLPPIVSNTATDTLKSRSTGECLYTIFVNWPVLPDIAPGQIDQFEALSKLQLPVSTSARMASQDYFAAWSRSVQYVVLAE